MKIVLIVFLIHFSGFLEAQNNNFEIKKIDTYPIFANYFIGTDEMDYQYFVRDNVFLKKKKLENLEYKNLALGKITKIDLQNPLKIVLYYEDFNTIVTLDNQLNETNKINFSEAKLPILTHAVGMASQNRFWIYNSLSQKIGLYDYLNNLYSEITPLIVGDIQFYTTDFNFFQWIDDQNVWYTCDIFGKITTNGKIPEAEQIQILNNYKLLFLFKNKLSFIDLTTNEKKIIEIIENSIEGFGYKNEILTIFANQKISNYKIKLP